MTDNLKNVISLMKDANNKQEFLDIFGKFASANEWIPTQKELRFLDATMTFLIEENS